MNFQLIDIVKKNIPNFDSGSETDLIKAEKILKVYQKTDGNFSQNDIDEFLSFYKEKGNRYDEILKDENLARILKGEDFTVKHSKNSIWKLDDELKEDFAEDFEENILSFIKINIQNNNWLNLRNFYRNYFQVLSVNVLDDLMENITSKNTLIISTLHDYAKYTLLLNEYKFAVNSDYYGLQSDIDSHYFNEQILDINNTISDHQKTDAKNKFVLGRIFVALNNFDAYSENLRDVLKSNSKIGEKWASKDNTVLNKIGSTTQNASEKNYGNIAEWFMLSVFYFTISFTIYKFVSWNVQFFMIFCAFEIIIFLFASKKLNELFEKESKSQNDQSFRRKLKKFTFKFFMLQIYVAIIGVAIALFVGLIALAIASGGGAIFAVVIVVRLLIKFFKKD